MYNIIHTNHAPKPIGPYNQGIKKKNIVVTSGQIAIDINNKIISHDVTKQTIIVLHNIKYIIQTSGLKIKDIIKINIFIINLDEINKINFVYNKFFQDNSARLPSRTCVEVKKLPKNAKIEIDAIAIRS